MPEPRHPYANDAQDRRRSDEGTDDDEQHDVCRESGCPTPSTRIVLVLPFRVCAVVHTEFLTSWRIEAVLPARCVAVQCDTDTAAEP